MFSGAVHDRPDFRIPLCVFLLLIKENTPSLLAFDIGFPFQNNIILDIKDEEILQMTVFSIWLVWGFF